jgi:predicted nucleotidyltransferase
MVKNLESEYSIKQLSDILKRPYVKIHNSIKRLANNSIIKETIKGKSHYCIFDYKNNLDVACFINAQMAKSFLEGNKKLRIFISNLINSLTFPDYTLLLFGSIAKGSADEKSDIDLAIITSLENKAAAENTMNSLKRISNLNIHSFEFRYNEFIEMLKSKEMNVGKEIAKTNIIFKGCEQFYECLRLAE